MFQTIFCVLLIALGVAAFVFRSKKRAMTHDEYERRRQQIEKDHTSSYTRDNAFERLESDFRDSAHDNRLARLISLIVGLVALLLGVVVLFFSTFVVIPTMEVGVKTTFGAPTGNLPNGAHFKAPWEDITLMDATVQTDVHNKVDEKTINCVNTRIEHQIVACTNVYVKWQIEEPRAGELFQHYRTFDNLRQSLVTTNLQNAMNSVFANYDPLAVDKDGSFTAPAPATLSAKVKDELTAMVGDKVKILEVGVTIMNYDPPTQQKINDLQGQVAQTRIAAQAVETAKKQAEANQVLAQSVSNNPNVLVSKCFDHMGDMITKGQAIPAGFSCWPASGSAVVIPAATK